MGLINPIPNRFMGRITNRGSTPSTTWGTQVSTGATPNTYSSYVDLLGATTSYATFHIRIMVYGVGAATSNPDGLVTIGIDYSGGTSYTDVIQHLLVSGAGTSAMGAIVYDFPLYIPSGARIAAKASTARASVTGTRVLVDLYGKPSRPDQVRAGSYVTTFGANTAASNGTTVTPGTSAEGTTTTISSDIAKAVWWWQAGVGCSDTSMAGGGLFTVLDVGVGTATGTLDWVITDQLWAAWNTSEQTGMVNVHPSQFVFPIPGGAGYDVFARMACTGTPDSGHSVAVYGLGG